MPLDPDPVSGDPCRCLRLLRENGYLTRAEHMRGTMNWSELWVWMQERDMSQHEIWQQYGTNGRTEKDEEGTDADHTG